METDYFHRRCGTWVFTRAGPPFVTGEFVSGIGVTMANGKPPVVGEMLKCPGCPYPIGFHNGAFRIHVRP